MTGGDDGFRAFGREDWAALAHPSVVPDDEIELAEAVAGEVRMATDEILEIYRPLCQLLDVVMTTARSSARAVDGFLAVEPGPSPFVVGVAGGVAVGKSTVALVLEALLGRGRHPRSVAGLCTDAFLFPNDVLEARGLSDRKGFPDTYDHAALVGALASIRAGAPDVEVPVYSHSAYDVVAGATRTIDRPDVVVVEGLNVLQIGPVDTNRPAVVSDFVDVVVYVDAAERDAAAWFEQRLLGLRGVAGDQDGAFLRWLCSLSEEEVRDVARVTWSEINLVNVRRHVAPSRRRAHVVLHKGSDHRVDQVLVRRP